MYSKCILGILFVVLNQFVDIGITTTTSPALDIAALCLDSWPAAIFTQILTSDLDLQSLQIMQQCLFTSLLGPSLSSMVKPGLHELTPDISWYNTEPSNTHYWFVLFWNCTRWALAVNALYSVLSAELCSLTLVLIWQVNLSGTNIWFSQLGKPQQHVKAMVLIHGAGWVVMYAPVRVCWFRPLQHQHGPSWAHVPVPSYTRTSHVALQYRCKTTGSRQENQLLFSWTQRRTSTMLPLLRCHL